MQVMLTAVIVLSRMPNPLVAMGTHGIRRISFSAMSSIRTRCPPSASRARAAAARTSTKLAVRENWRSWERPWPLFTLRTPPLHCCADAKVETSWCKTLSGARELVPRPRSSRPPALSRRRADASGLGHELVAHGVAQELPGASRPSAYALPPSRRWGVRASGGRSVPALPPKLAALALPAPSLAAASYCELVC